MALIVIIVVVVIVATGGKKHPSSHTTLPTPTSAATSATTTPSASTSTPPTTAPASLLDLVPSAFKDSCETAPSADIFDSSSSGEVFCSGSDVPTADGIVYIQYSDSSGSEGYYTNTLLAANGMQENQGDCGTLTFTGQATNGNYCETTITNQGSNSPTGRQFVFSGSSFNVGSGGNISGVCQSSSSGFTVVGWTDDPTDLTALAISCTSDTSTEKDLQNHYLSGDYDLKS